MRDIFLIFHSNKHKLLRYFPCFVLFVCLFNGSNFISNMTMGNKKKKMLRSPQTSHYERRNTAMNPSKPPCIFNQLEGLFKENSLQGFCFFLFFINFNVVALWGREACSESDAYHSCHQRLQLEIGIFIDLRQSSHFSLSQRRM